MAVQRIFLPAVSLHRYFLHPDDLWDAEEEERGPDRSERPPQTGETAALDLISDRHTDKCVWLEHLKNIFINFYQKQLFSLRCYDLSDKKKLSFISTPF